MIKSPARSKPRKPSDRLSPEATMPKPVNRPPSENSANTRHGEGSSWLRRKISNIRGDNLRPGSDPESHDALGFRNPDASGSTILHEFSDSSRQLRDIVQRVRSGPSGPKDVDNACDQFFKYQAKALALCSNVLLDELGPSRHLSNAAESIPRRDSSLESPHALFDQRSSFSGRSLSEVATNSGGRSAHLVGDQWLNAVREWKMYLELLAEWHKTSLAETYRKFEQDATPDMVEALFTSKQFRREAVYRMRNHSVTRVMSADPQFFPRYEIRFRNYERVKKELGQVVDLLQCGESGISPKRTVHEFLISQHGDAVLEFANIHPEASMSDPVFRFRVSSHMLSETSPIFARMFSGGVGSLRLHDDEDINAHLPPPATRYICKDGSEARLYRMPQCELNHWQSLDILLHAAHMHIDKVPREVSFNQLVAIAECCIRYKSTSPLEMVAENRWLRRWMHMDADNMGDGMLVICYAFGLRDMFTRLSKSAILNLVDERDLQSKPWPQRIKDKIWAIRLAKLAQVHDCCTSMIQEYIREPSRSMTDDVQTTSPAEFSNNYHPVPAPMPLTSLSTRPRCPKGSHWCDASNLGWMMLMYNEMNLLSHIVRPNVLAHLPEPQQQQPRSLAQVMEALRRVPSPATPVHRGGICDPGPAFRSSVNDIFNSVTGLTLYDVSGKSHGWALSKRHEADPQQVIPGMGMAAPEQNHSVSNEFPENLRLKIMSKIDDIDDLHSMAMVNKNYYNTYKNHELYLIRNILRSDRIRKGNPLLQKPVLPKSTSNAEEKVLKEVSDVLKEGAGRQEMDAMTICDDDESLLDDDASIDGTPAPSISESLWNESRMKTERARTTDRMMQTIARRPVPNRPTYTAPPTHLSADEEEDDSDSSTPSSKTTPRQTSPSRSDGPPTMTEAEAHQILWPDDVVKKVVAETNTRRVGSRGGPGAGGPGSRGREDALGEKFLLNDKSFSELLEEKSLAASEPKQLLTEHVRRVGVLKREGKDRKR